MLVDPNPAGAACETVVEDTATFYARVIKRLGRNARGGEPGMQGGISPGVLEAPDAARLWALLLDQQLSVAQEASVLMGLRIHGESPAMLAAFMRQTRQRCRLVAPSVPSVTSVTSVISVKSVISDSASPSVAGLERPAVVVLYAFGTARRHPCLAALLALQLTQSGTPTLLVTHDAQRGPNTTAVLHALGHDPADSSEQATARLTAGELAWLPVAALSLPLARVLGRRAELGYRNTAHALVKLLVPVEGAAVLVANYTHPAYRTNFAAAVAELGMSALLVRGTEGDPVAWEAATHPSLAWIAGQPVVLEPAVAVHEATAHGEADVDPSDPTDVSAIARFCKAVLQGDQRLPVALARQCTILASLARQAGLHGSLIGRGAEPPSR